MILLYIDDLVIPEELALLGYMCYVYVLKLIAQFNEITLKHISKTINFLSSFILLIKET
jgi:hypothetical protein